MPQATLQTKLARPSLYIMIGALLVAIFSLLASGYFFTGFLGDGRTGLGALQAFLVCFGIGSGLYVPAIIVFFMARHVRGFGPKKPIGFAGTFISLPLWAYGGASMMLRLPYWPYGLAAMFMGLGLLFWSVSVLRNITQR